MRRFLLAAAVMGLGLALSGTATAGGKGGQFVGQSGGSCQSSCQSSQKGCYQQTYGTKCSYGYCYKGRNHCHWSQSCWSPEHDCTVYRCPSTGCDYYWCGRDDCYYPTHHRPYGHCR